MIENRSNNQQRFVGGDRYQEQGEHRACLWCGAKQTKVLIPRTVEDVSWVTA